MGSGSARHSQEWEGSSPAHLSPSGTPFWWSEPSRKLLTKGKYGQQRHGLSIPMQVGKSGFETEVIVLEPVQPASTPMAKVSLEQTRVMHFLFLMKPEQFLQHPWWKRALIFNGPETSLYLSSHFIFRLNHPYKCIKICMAFDVFICKDNSQRVVCFLLYTR